MTAAMMILWVMYGHVCRVHIDTKKSFAHIYLLGETINVHFVKPV